MVGPIQGGTTMRLMVNVPADQNSQAGVLVAGTTKR